MAVGRFDLFYSYIYVLVAAFMPRVKIPIGAYRLRDSLESKDIFWLLSYFVKDAVLLFAILLEVFSAHR